MRVVLLMLATSVAACGAESAERAVDAAAHDTSTSGDARSSGQTPSWNRAGCDAEPMACFDPLDSCAGMRPHCGCDGVTIMVPCGLSPKPYAHDGEC